MILRRLYLYLTELLYHQLAWSYDWVATIVSAGYWQHWVRSILPDLSGHRILELGHGPGHLQEALLRLDRGVVGLDRSPEMSRQAARRLRNQRASLVHGDALHLPFVDHTFDCVAATFPTFYISANTLNEVYRVPKPAGKIVVVPGAWLVAPRGVLQHFAAGIFHFFGLSQDWSQAAYRTFVVPMQKAGFHVMVERRPFRSSEIFVIIGTK